MRKSSQYYFFILVLYLFTFEFALMQFVPHFKYVDELYALLYAILLLYKMFHNIKMYKIDVVLFILCIILSFIGLCSNLIYQYQILPAVFKDILLSMKFFMGIYVTCFLFERFDFEHYKNDIKVHVKFLISLLFVLLIVDLVFEIFPSPEMRYGLRSEQLFFGHPTGLASVSFFLLLMLILTYKQKTMDLVFILMSCFLVGMSLRAKSIAIVVLFLYLYYLVVIRNKKVLIRYFVVVAPLIITIAWDQIYGYFFGPLSLTSARGALFYKSFQIMQDHFPLGAGFGTYASAPSGDYYSTLYPMYDLDHIWGLGQDWPAFVSDSFWPMIFGQFGILGTIIYIGVIGIIWVKVSKIFKYNRYYYLAGVGAIAYLMVSSTAESAFVNPLALPLSVVLGIAFSHGKQICKL